MLSKIVFVLGVAIIGSAIAACDLKGQWASECKDPQMVPMDDTMKMAILDAHNKMRNEIAMGKIPNYGPAANMATMEWDDALAANAALNVRQCEMKHDKCHTDQFKSSGQNLAMYMTTGSAQKSSDQIANMAKGQWFDGEQKNGAYYGWMDNINKFTTVGDEGRTVGHFTQYVWGSAQKVGCAVSTSKKNMKGRDWSATWLACDYSYGNMIGAPVYESGSSASKCKTGKNNVYPGLCSTNEKYNV